MYHPRSGACEMALRLLAHEGRDLMSAQVITYLAGPIAEAKDGHRSRASVLAIGGGQDWEYANLCVRDFARDPDECRKMLDSLWKRTATLVQDNWQVITALAEALMARRSLTGPEALAIMRAAETPNRLSDLGFPNVMRAA